MFLNFPLEFTIRKYSGVRLEVVKRVMEEEGHNYVAIEDKAWDRLFMGFRPSPNLCIRFFCLIKEFIIGDHTEKGSPVC